MIQTVSYTLFHPWTCRSCGAAVPAFVEHGKNQGCELPDPEISGSAVTQPQPAETSIDQTALLAIERIVGDDFCEDLDMRGFTSGLDGDLKTAWEKLSAVYRIAHSHVQSHSCYSRHESWREEARGDERGK